MTWNDIVPPGELAPPPLVPNPEFFVPVDPSQWVPYPEPYYGYFHQPALPLAHQPALPLAHQSEQVAHDPYRWGHVPAPVMDIDHHPDPCETYQGPHPEQMAYYNPDAPIGLTDDLLDEKPVKESHDNKNLIDRMDEMSTAFFNAGRQDFEARMKKYEHKMTRVSRDDVELIPPSKRGTYSHVYNMNRVDPLKRPKKIIFRAMAREEFLPDDSLLTIEFIDHAGNLCSSTIPERLVGTNVKLGDANYHADPEQFSLIPTENFEATANSLTRLAMDCARADLHQQIHFKSIGGSLAKPIKQIFEECKAARVPINLAILSGVQFPGFLNGSNVVDPKARQTVESIYRSAMGTRTLIETH